MPDLIHIFLGIALIMIVFSVLLMHLFGKIVNQKWERTSPEKIIPNIMENLKDRADSEINHVEVGINSFENELDEIYRKMEALESLDETKGLKINKAEIENEIGEKDGEEGEDILEEDIAKKYIEDIIEEDKIIEDNVKKEEKIEEKIIEKNKEKSKDEINGFVEEKEQKMDGSRHREIYQAFDAGQTITDLARNFKKNKGEIELILNLRGCDDRKEKTNGYFDL